jgi:hypothetical protein
MPLLLSSALVAATAALLVSPASAQDVFAMVSAQQMQVQAQSQYSWTLSAATPKPSTLSVPVDGGSSSSSSSGSSGSGTVTFTTTYTRQLTNALLQVRRSRPHGQCLERQPQRDSSAVGVP